MPGTRGLFIPGPTNVPQEVRLAMDISMEDQRAPDLPAFTLPLFADVKKVFKTEMAQVFLFPASGTGGWEAAMTNTLSPGDKVLIARLGQHFVLLCRPPRPDRRAGERRELRLERRELPGDVLVIVEERGGG